jgi:diguanylate cyclase (GGDEF)-like protein
MRPLGAGRRRIGTLLQLHDVTARENERRQVMQHLAQRDAEQALLRDQALRDPLTGLWNRRALEERFVHERRAGAEIASPLAVVLLDLDHFKRVNDRHGHAVGDAVLRDVGHELRAAVRAGDAVFRIGGEEFALLLPGLDAQQAQRRLADLHLRFEGLRPGGLPEAVSFSAGVSSTVGQGWSLAALLAAYPGPFHALPVSWTRILPADAPLASPQAWTHLLDRLTAADWPDEIDHGPALGEIISLLSQGVAAAEAIGEALLHGRTLAIWRKALLAGPAASLDLTLETLKQDDGLDACVSVAWMPASALAASPRRFVRLLGLNSSRWPRGISEDRLLSDHIIPTAELDPLPVGAADRRDFATIIATSERQVVLSRARRDSDGRLLGRSTLLQGQPDEIYLRRNRVPDHAFSETDRLTARPLEFRTLPQAVAVATCWRNWLREEVTPHDGLVRADHPVVQAILARTQSASSLRQLLRNPIGFVWHYGLRWRAPESVDDPLVLDALAMGDLVHLTLDQALRALEANGGLATATAQEIASAVDGAAGDVAEFWETERPVPPRVIWQRTLDEARELSRRALAFGDERLPGARAFGEVPFGGTEPKTDVVPPWDATAIVEIPDAGFRIAGYIDRLDISGDGRRALVRDYKTGRKPKDSIILDGGKELQRCLYAFAVKAMLGDNVAISASLLYPRDEIDLRLDDPDATLVEVAAYLSAARGNLLSGGCVLGVDTGGNYDDLAFALPANAGATYCKRKIAAATERLGAATQVWEAP